jgi:fatty-acyl-CoA synthase
VERSDRVATLSWNHYQHLEAYFGVPCSETVLHTLNLRLHSDDLAYIAGHAEAKVLIVDESLLPLYEKFADRVGVRHLVVVTETGEELPEGAIDYEKLLDEADEADFEYPEPDETTAAAMCYTSGTTGRPKGALYSYREIALLSLTSAMVDTSAISASDVVLPVVPMFHANAWNMPFTCTLVGAKQVFPGSYQGPDQVRRRVDQLNGA